MIKLKPVMALAAVAVLFSLGTSPLAAQNQQQNQQPGRGNFDPAQFRQRMMDRYREQLDVKSDDEWKIIEERITKVMEARREVGGGMGGFGRGGRGPGGGPGGNNPPPANADAQGGGGGARRGGPGGFGPPEASPEAEALQKALDGKASADELKAKLAKLREARKVKEANLDKAQEDLRKILSVRQEAAAVLAGLLK